MPPLEADEGLKSPRRADSEEQSSPKKGVVSQNSLDPGDIRPIQRPQPKKPAGNLHNFSFIILVAL